MSSGLLDRALTDARTRLRTDGGLLITVTLAVVGVPAMLAQVVIALADTTETVVNGRTMTQLALKPYEGVALAALVLAILVGELIVARMLLARGETVRRSAQLAGRRVLPLVGAQLLVMIAVIPVLIVLGGVAAFGGAVAGTVITILLFAGIVFLGARLMLLPAVAVDNARGPVALLKEAWRLTKGRTRTLVLLLLVTSIVTGIVLAAARLVVASAATLLGGPVNGTIFGAATAGLVFALALLVTLALVVAVFDQLRRPASVGDEGNLGR